MVIYLASPYMHANEAVRQERHDAAVHAAIRIMAETGEAVFSPIAHSHYMHLWSAGKIGGDWRQWAEFDRAVIASCSAFYVLKLPGWDESVGIAAETRIARELNIPIQHVEVPA